VNSISAVTSAELFNKTPKNKLVSGSLYSQNKK